MRIYICLNVIVDYRLLFLLLDFTGECTECERKFEQTAIGVQRPTKETFEKLLPFFLQDLPNARCAKAGRPAYSRAVKLGTTFNGSLTIEASHFASFHTSLVKSVDFYTSLKQARAVADDIQTDLRRNGHNVTFFPYRYYHHSKSVIPPSIINQLKLRILSNFSIFYVFYEQYLTIWNDTLISMGISLSVIFVATFILTGFDIISAILVAFMVTVIVVNMGGLLWIWNVSLNAVSLVNLVVVSCILLFIVTLAIIFTCKFSLSFPLYLTM